MKADAIIVSAGKGQRFGVHLVQVYGIALGCYAACRHRQHIFALIYGSEAHRVGIEGQIGARAYPNLKDPSSGIGEKLSAQLAKPEVLQGSHAPVVRGSDAVKCR